MMMNANAVAIVMMVRLGHCRSSGAKGNNSDSHGANELFHAFFFSWWGKSNDRSSKGLGDGIHGYRSKMKCGSYSSNDIINRPMIGFYNKGILGA
jgi:hypothetical protein